LFEKVALLADFMDGLTVLHGHSIVHRDVKSDNNLLGRNGGSPVLGDFGSSR
jgi:serine/threonine protein kinase